MRKSGALLHPENERTVSDHNAKRYSFTVRLSEALYFVLCTFTVGKTATTEDIRTALLHYYHLKKIKGKGYPKTGREGTEV